MTGKAVIYYGGFLHRAGGAFMHAQTIAPELANSGWEIRLVTLDDLPLVLRYLPHAIEKAVNLFSFPLGFYYKGRLTGWLYKLLFNHQADLRIFEDIYIAWNSQTPSVTLLHAVWSDNLQAFNFDERQRNALVAREAEKMNTIEHKIVTVSEAYRAYLLETHFEAFRLRNLAVIPLAVTLPQTNADRAGSRSQKSIVFCGALEARKNVQFLLEVFERLVAEDGAFRLTIIGDGPQRNQLEQHARARSLAVSFLGRLEHDEVIRELYRHDIYVHTSTKESFSFSLLEAKLAGLTTCAFAGLQVPEEFIERPVHSFEIEDWCRAIQEPNPEVKHFDPEKYTPSFMAQATLDLAFSSQDERSNLVQTK